MPVREQLLDNRRAKNPQQPQKRTASKPKATRYSIFASVLLLATGLVLLTPRAVAQRVKTDGKRKLITQIKPVYPPLARKINLAGNVKVVAVIAPDGRVVRTQVVGGSPVLVQAVIDAVDKSRWQVETEETKEMIEVSFQIDDE